MILINEIVSLVYICYINIKKIRKNILSFEKVQLLEFLSTVLALLFELNHQDSFIETNIQLLVRI